MKSSEYGRISDELLSAYIDNAITEQERNWVEAAVAADAEVAWRLDTLQQTVQLLHALPELALPRSFTIQESFLIHEDPRTAHAAGQVSGASWFGRMARNWRGFWQAGTPVYRNLAAASLVLLLVLVGGDVLLGSGSSALEGITAPASELASSEIPPSTEPAQERAAEEPRAASAPMEPAAENDEAEGDNAAQEETLLADSAREETPLEETQSDDAAPEQVAEPPAAQERASAPPDNAPPGSQPEVAAAAMAEAPAAEAAPPPGEALSLALPPDEAPPVPPSEALGRTGREGLGGGAAQPQARLYGESDEAGLAAADTFAEAASPAEAADAISAQTAPLTSSAEVTSVASSPLDASAVAQPRVAAAETETDVAAKQAAEAGDVAAQETPYAEPHAPAPPALEDSSAPANGDESPAVAALPTAQPLPQPAAEAQPPADTELSSNLPLRPIGLGLLFATLIFGGLWWRSRGEA